MHAFGTNPKKWWPLDGFFAIADQTFQQYRLPTVFVGDGEALSLVKKHPKFHADRHAIAQDFDIRESAVVIQKSIAMLTTDSGPMHLAFAVRCPTLTLFGATQPSIYGPCVDLDQHRVIHRDPLDKLTVEEVWDAWNGKLKIENDPE